MGIRETLYLVDFGLYCKNRGKIFQVGKNISDWLGCQKFLLLCLVLFGTGNMIIIVTWYHRLSMFLYSISNTFIYILLHGQYNIYY